MAKTKDTESRAPLPSSVTDGMVPLLAVEGATAVSIHGREYAVDADGFVHVHPDDIEPLRAHGALR